MSGVREENGQLAGYVYVMWATGAGTDLMERIAAPMVGGIFTSFLLELLIYPVLYAIWKWRYEMKHGAVVPQYHGVVRAGKVVND